MTTTTNPGRPPQRQTSGPGLGRTIGLLGILSLALLFGPVVTLAAADRL